MPPRGRLGTGPGRIVAVALAAAIVAELALLLLGPGDPGPAPAEVDASAYFDAAQIDRGRDFQTGQRNLALAAFAIEVATLALLALGRPRRLGPVLARLGTRPLLGAAAAGAGISLLLALVALPTGWLAHERAVDVGLVTQDVWGWLADRGRSAAIGAVLAAIGAAVLIGLQRRLPRTWWVAGSAVVVAYAIFTTLLAPVVLAPLFNDFEPLPDGAARQEVIALADRAGVDVGEVYSVDASRRSTSLNAYVSGIGSTKRVVLYDNLLERAEGPALRSVVAHELGHVAHRDIPRGILFVALIAPLGVLTVALGRDGARPPDGGRAGHPRRAARLRAGARRRRVRARTRRQPALTRGRGERRRVRPRADRGPGWLHLPAAPPGAEQRQRSRPVGTGRRPPAHPPDHDREDRSGGRIPEVPHGRCERCVPSRC